MLETGIGRAELDVLKARIGKLEEKL